MLTKNQLEAMLPLEGGWHVTEYKATVDWPLPSNNPYKDGEVIVKASDGHETVEVEAIPKWDAMPGEPTVVFYLTVRHDLTGVAEDNLYDQYTNVEHSSVCGALGTLIRCVEHINRGGPYADHED